MIVIYRQSLACLRRYWWLYLLMAAILPTLYGAVGPFALIVYLPFVFILHRHFLFGDTRTAVLPGEDRREAAFFAVSLGILLFGIGLNLGLHLFWRDLPRPLEPWRGLIFWATQALCHGLTLSLFGTLLPAMVAGDHYWLLPTLRRMRRTSLLVALRLLLGPGLFSVLAIIVVVFVAQLLRHISPPASFFVMTWGLTALFLFSVTLAVAVLCEAYRRVPPTLVDTPS